MSDKKRLYFVEVTIPDAVKNAHEGIDPAEILRIKLDEYIADTGTKSSRQLKEMVYEDIKIYGWHPSDANKTAYTITFMNARHHDVYNHHVPAFRTWMNNDCGITYDYETYTDIPYEVATIDNINGNEVTHEGHNMNYDVAKHKAFMEDMPIARGFELN